MVHQLNIEMGDIVIIEVFQSTTVERKHEATIEVETPGLVLVSCTRDDEDLKMVFHAE